MEISEIVFTQAASPRNQTMTGYQTGSDPLNVTNCYDPWKIVKLSSPKQRAPVIKQ